jgi:hypothetical protein
MDTTATSATAGCLPIAASTSMLEMFSPFDVAVGMPDRQVA